MMLPVMRFAGFATLPYSSALLALSLKEQTASSLMEC
jgi:hypothetical protein